MFYPELIVGILLTYGITNIVTQGAIFYSFREWFSKKVAEDTCFVYVYSFLFKLLNCPMCFGFWAGAFVGIFVGPFESWNAIFNGAVYSGTTWLLFCLAQFLGQGYDPSRTINVVFQNELQQKFINTEEESKQ